MKEHIAPTPEVHELEHKDTDLYPEVQQTMDDLGEILEDYEETSEVERTPSGEPILPNEVIDKWLEKEGYGHKKAGTFNNESTFVYFKTCNLVDNKEEIDSTLAMARQLTGQGAIHPESQWVVKKDADKYLLVVVSPKLEAWNISDEMDGKYDDKSDRPSHDNSHLLRWFKRIDPTFTPDQPIPEDSLLHHFNWQEATNPDNWGWDATGTLFPIDVEVLIPSEQGHKNYEPWKRRAPVMDDAFDFDSYV